MTSNSTAKPIVHIAPDEKFIDAAYEIYEKAFPGKNRFIILLREDQHKVTYLSKEKDYEYIDTSNNYLSLVKGKIDNAEILIFHGMTTEQAHIAMSASKKNKALIWTVFGYEIYTNPYLFGNEIFGHKTYERFVFSFKKKLKNILRPHYYRFIKGKQDPNRFRLQTFREMDYVGMLYKEEIQLYDEKIDLKPNIKQLKFTYYPLDVIIDKEQKQILGNNILLGNSASYTNNHLEALDLLDEIDLRDRKIIAPLSYGNEGYAEEIGIEGKKAFNDKFEPLTEFLPLSEYQQILQGCGVVIMNHYRQQAVGNVLNTLYMGAKVYLSKKNTLYHYLKRIGCHVYSIEDDLNPENSHALDLLNNNEIEHNRAILREELSLDRICNELRTTIKPLLN